MVGAAPEVLSPAVCPNQQNMSRLNRCLLACSCGLMLCVSNDTVMAQGAQGGGRSRPGNSQGGSRQRQGNFDPAQFQQRMLDRYKERLEITDDSEWKAIQPLIQKVIEARMAAGFSGRGVISRGGRSVGNTSQTEQTQRGAGAPSSAPAEQLRKAVDTKAPSAEVIAALAKYHADRKQKQASLERAQAHLRSVLSPRQEAIATLSGLL